MRVHVTPKKFTPNLQIFYTFPVFGLNVKKFTPDVKKFTPDLQIFYTFPVFGLNVKVFGVKVPPMKRIIFIKLYPTSKRRMLLSENLPQTSRFFTRIYPPYPCHYATLLVCQNRVFGEPPLPHQQWSAAPPPPPPVSLCLTT